MFLFIFESLGTSELILIGIVALIFLGPRRLPEIARKVGKVMADLRGTANEFKQTWEREIDFEEEAKALRLDLIEEESALEEPVPRENSILPDADRPEGAGTAAAMNAPAIRSIDKDRFDALKLEAGPPVNAEGGDPEPDEDEPDLLSDKRNWL